MSRVNKELTVIYIVGVAVVVVGVMITVGTIKYLVGKL